MVMNENLRKVSARSGINQVWNLMSALLQNSHVERFGMLVHKIELRRNPVEDRAISGFSGQKSVPE